MYLQLDKAYVDDLKIHDLADPAMVYSLRSAKRTLAIRRADSPRASRPGILDRTRFPGQQVIDLAGYTWGPDDASAQANDDALRAKFALPGAHVFRFRRKGLAFDEQLSFTIAAPPAPVAEGYSRTVRWTASLVGADPRVYTAAIATASYDPTAALAGNGAAIPLQMPIVFAATTASELFITNGGQYRTPPTLTVHGPASSGFAIDNDATGESIYIVGALGSSDTLIVDVGARSLKLNGAERKDLFDATRSTWWELGPGTTPVRLRGTGFSTGTTLLTVQYRDARI